MKTKKQFNLYTFTIGKFCSTEADSVEQAISNFNQRLNLDPNGYHHPNMKYNFDPIRIITEQKINDETILKFNMNKLIFQFYQKILGKHLIGVTSKID